MRKIIFYQAVTQFHNTGDLIINKSLIEHLRPFGDLVLDDKNVPRIFLEQLAVNSTEKLSYNTSKSFLIYQLYLSMRHCGDPETQVYMISGPGHLFGYSRKRIFRNIITGLYFCLLNILGCDIIKLGFSIGPEISKGLIISEKFKSFFIKRYFVRDSSSISIANSNGIKKAEFFPDLAWSYNFPKVNRSSNSKKCVFLSFRNDILDYSEKNKLMNSIGQLLKIFQKNSFNSFVLGYQVDSDYRFCEEIFGRYAGKFSIALKKDKIVAGNSASTFVEFDYIVSNRLHVLLNGMKIGPVPIPIIDTDKHQKISSLFSDNNMKMLIIDLNFNARQIENTITNALRNYQQIRADTKKIVQEHTELSTNIISGIFQSID